MQILDGNILSKLIKSEIALEVEAMLQLGLKQPHLAAILVGNDGASETYVASKVRSCETVGFNSTLIRLPATATEEEVLDEIKKLNENSDIDGFICQLPLPKHIDEQKIILAIDPKKDVDGFHPVNVGRMVQGLPTFLPATPAGILEILKRYDIETDGKECVVLGRSNIVGMPMSILLARKGYPGNCTVTLCHSRTKKLKAHLKKADIIIAAIGIPEYVTKDMVKKGAVVIDVGISRIADTSKKSGYTLKGDVAFDEVAPICSYITPVPGGVGLMTVTSLLLNTLKAAKKEIYP
jgi:methylenetetrahydrofolate dehydrogenase (NADP+)/methenyltetrahydrofolate cyclohydrolase